MTTIDIRFDLGDLNNVAADILVRLRAAVDQAVGDIATQAGKRWVVQAKQIAANLIQHLTRG
jgi:hypothetical protein